MSSIIRPAKESGTGKGSEAKLREAIRKEQQMPKVCGRHPRPVFHEESVCPCCRIEAEWLELTKEMST